MDGTTEPLIAVIGHPIAGNPSQFAVERALRAMKLEWRVLSFDVPPQNLAVALDGLAVLGVDGVLIDETLSTAAATWHAARNNQAVDGVTVEPPADITQATLQQAPADAPSAASLPAEMQPGATQPADADSDQTNAEPPSTTVADAAPAEKLPASPAPIDCLYRDDQQQLAATFAQLAWLREQVEQPAGSESSPQWVCVGESAGDSLLAAAAGCREAATPPHPDQIAAASVVLLGDDQGEPVEIDAEDWPPTQSGKLVVDLTCGHPEAARLTELGYRVVGPLERRIATLQACLQRWTGHSPAPEVLHDAIEEYLAV